VITDYIPLSDMYEASEQVEQITSYYSAIQLAGPAYAHGSLSTRVDKCLIETDSSLIMYPSCHSEVLAAAKEAWGARADVSDPSLAFFLEEGTGDPAFSVRSGAPLLKTGCFAYEQEIQGVDHEESRDPEPAKVAAGFWETRLATRTGGQQTESVTDGLQVQYIHRLSCF